MDGDCELPVSMPEVAAESAPVPVPESSTLMIAFSWSASEVVLLRVYEEMKITIKTPEKTLEHLSLPY